MVVLDFDSLDNQSCFRNWLENKIPVERVLVERFGLSFEDHKQLCLHPFEQGKTVSSVPTQG